MNRKLTLILALLILAVISVSIVTAVNETSDSIAADEYSDDSISQDINADDDNDKIAVDDDNQNNGGLTVKKVWVDNDNAAGKRPSSIKFSIIVNDEVSESGCEITESMGWQATLDFAVFSDNTYEIVEEDVPDGYTANVAGNIEEGFVITNTLKNDTDNNNTNPDDDNNNTNPDDDNNNTSPDDDNPKNNTPNNNNYIKEKKTIEKKTVTVPANESKKAKDTHKTGNPILLGILAVSAAGLAIQLRRKE